MKRIILLFLLLTMVCTAFAQELTVKSFEVKPMDLSASTSPRLDKNKQPCALVKVQLAAEGAKFDGNVLGDCAYKTGEYWVYMSQGSYQLKVRHPNFLPLTVNFRDYDIRGVESKTTYVLTLLMPQTSQEVKKQKLVINFQPANAMVLIDSKPYNGNGRVEAELPLGEHTYVIAATGYITVEGMVKLNGGSQRVLNETLEKDAAASVTTVQQTVTRQVSTPVAATVSATSGMDNGHEWVDLGLSVCWATTNIGAKDPGDYGDYYAWGETTTKSDYSRSSYKWGNGSENIYVTKYWTFSDYGTDDNKTELDLTDDVAHVMWGGNWLMPTYDELEELKEKCKWKWTKQNGHKGYKVTGPNGKSIFLPAAGFRSYSSLGRVGMVGYYWSRTLCESGPLSAWVLDFDSFDLSNVHTNNIERCRGYTVRPVRLSE